MRGAWRGEGQGPGWSGCLRCFGAWGLRRAICLRDPPRTPSPEACRESEGPEPEGKGVNKGGREPPFSSETVLLTTAVAGVWPASAQVPCAPSMPFPDRRKSPLGMFALRKHCNFFYN